MMTTMNAMMAAANTPITIPATAPPDRPTEAYINGILHTVSVNITGKYIISFWKDIIWAGVTLWH